MRVMITGATGFIGYHTVNAMLGAGHEVVLLIRNEKKMQDIYGDRIQHHVVGDITDAAAVAAALDGCDGVISIAALVSTDAKDAQLVYDTNVCATQLIVGGAVERGLEKIIHVSSVTALYDPKASTLDENSPPGPATTSYGRSKAACETYVRELQGQGAPVYITYPVSVIGPDAPSLTEPHEGIRTFMGSLAPLMPSGNQYVDVRDIAKAHLLLIEGNAPYGGYVLGGHYVTWAEQLELINKITGRNIPGVRLPGALMRASGRLFDWVNSVSNADIPLTYEGAVYATNWKIMDSSRTLRELDFSFRDLEESFVDSLSWMHQAGHLSAVQAGSLAVDAEMRVGR